jgi:Zn-dependent M28 family amino/carboxypeptidase
VTTVTMENTGSTDHVPFDAVGLPGFQFIQDGRDYGSRTHHSNIDTYEHLAEADMKQAAVVMASFLYQAAMLDAPFPRKPLPVEPPKKAEKKPAAAQPKS